MNLKYGKSDVFLSLPANMEWRALKQEDLQIEKSEDEIVEEAVEQLILQLKTEIGPKSRLLIIIPDHTRRCHVDLILEHLVDRLKKELQASLSILIAKSKQVSP